MQLMESSVSRINEMRLKQNSIYGVMEKVPISLWKSLHDDFNTACKIALDCAQQYEEMSKSYQEIGYELTEANDWINKRKSEYEKYNSRKIADLEKECLEQARLNGMGSSREAALLAKIEQLERGETINPECSASFNRHRHLEQARIKELTLGQTIFKKLKKMMQKGSIS